MSFYNRAAALLVRPFTNQLGSVEPLDVVPYGGLQRASASVASNTSVQVLAAPPAGKVYRLHRYGIGAGEGLAAFSAILMAIGDSNGDIDADLQVFAAAQTIIGAGKGLEGTLSGAAVTLFQLSGGTATMWLTYDVVTFPNMI